MNQYELFDPDPTGFLTRAPFAPGSETSAAAGRHMDRTGKHGTIKRKVYTHLLSWSIVREGGGLTDEELHYRVSDHMQCKSTSIVSARNALVKDGLVEDSGKKRKSPTSGLMATVWRVK